MSRPGAAKPMAPGDVVHLTPRTVGAPSVAWSQPKVRVIAIAGPQVTVELSDGTHLTTSQRNIHRNPSHPPAAVDTAPRVRTLPGAPARIDPAHGDELPLFDLDGEPA